ncbi:MAG TPA: hypothetical protein VGI10_18990 [Polyangiaceae bacterium]|jgi:hypothetical protein
MWSSRRLAALSGASLLVAALLSVAQATARVEGDSEYSKAQTYSGALRYLRVDLGYEIVERDPDAAYLIFQYRQPGQKDTTTGTVQVIDSGDHVKMLVEIPKLPEYHERVLRDGLIRKLHDEYGTPPRKPPPPEKKPPPSDAGADSG